MTTKDFSEALDYVRTEWGDDIIKEICFAEKKPMPLDEFFTYCTACGGNWGGMLLTGVRELYPAVWDAIPDNMGVNAFATICNLLFLLNIDTRG